MGLFMARLFGLGGSLLAAAIVYFNWQELLREGMYSFKDRQTRYGAGQIYGGPGDDRRPGGGSV